MRRENYEGYKAALRAKVWTPGWEHVHLLELQEHFGFGFAVREALSLVTTEYVCVVQHDRTFMRPVDFARILRGMDAHAAQVSYVLLPTTSTGSGSQYAHTQRSRLGQMGIRDCDLSSLGLSLGSGARLLPCIQWYDSTHICRTSWYIHFVFAHDPPCVHPSLKAFEGGVEGWRGGAVLSKTPAVALVLRPGFIEDKFGQEQIRFWKQASACESANSAECPRDASRADDQGADMSRLSLKGREHPDSRNSPPAPDRGLASPDPADTAGNALADSKGQLLLEAFTTTWQTWLLDDTEVCNSQRCFVCVARVSRVRCHGVCHDVEYVAAFRHKGKYYSEAFRACSNHASMRSLPSD